MDPSSKQNARLEQRREWRLWRLIAQDPIKADKALLLSRRTVIGLWTSLLMETTVLLWFGVCFPYSLVIALLFLLILVTFFLALWLNFTPRIKTPDELLKHFITGPIGIVALSAAIILFIAQHEGISALLEQLTWFRPQFSARVIMFTLGLSAGPLVVLTSTVLWLALAFKPMNLLETSERRHNKSLERTRPHG